MQIRREASRRPWTFIQLVKSQVSSRRAALQKGGLNDLAAAETMTIDAPADAVVCSDLKACLSHVSVARSVDDVEGLRDIWEAARVSSLDADIDYFLSVVKHASRTVRPHVVLIRRPSEPPLMAIARLELLNIPLAIGYRALLRPQLRVIVVAFGGLLGVSGTEDERMLVDELRRAVDAGEADMLMLRKVDASGTLRRRVTEQVGWLRRSHNQPMARHWTASVPDSLDGFLAERSAKTRQTVRRQGRRLERQYSDCLRMRRFEHPGDMEELCRDMEAVAAKTYQRGLGVGYSGNVLDLSLIRLGLDRHWFCAWILYLRNRPVAFWSGTAYANTFSITATGFDPEYMKHGVGRYTMFRMFEDLCAADDIRWLDFGSGDADYKAEFGSVSCTESDVFLVRRGLRPVTINLAVTVFSFVNGWGRHLAQDTGWGRRLKRAWRNSRARQ